MKIVAFCGSARKEGNTALLLKTALEPLAEAGFDTELVELARKNVPGCKACMGCFKEKNRKCVFNDDVVNDCIEKMLEADGILLGSPTYFADISSEMKALIDRSGMVARANDNMFRRKLGAAVVAARRAGAIHAFDSINHFFQIGEMIIVGSSYWNIGHGRQKGEVSGDEEGLGTMKTLGENMAWLLKKIYG
ncbi:flavodoxin family protein [Desulfomarina profundi]|uniref:Flavodoxin family protein n=1 Tax=Desulfomarina profundi TaxID=2772557 RepID=A0A8D5FWL7_9BACT|nr:flavodoxin family protein [Desulfomarina profundi]BCL61277.1 flavodoxin family protein [Desulfomarina profundi]